MKHKVYISGTGRCGTTFLVIIFSYLGLDTGYTKETFTNHIYENCNSGLDRQWDDTPYILKSPAFLNQMDRLLNSFIIDYMIIPVRKFEDSAKSRAFHNQQPGGLWEAKNYEEQLSFFYKIFENYKKLEKEHNIPTIYLDFDTMVSSPEYLYQNIKPILRDITQEKFTEAFEFATNHQRRKKNV